MIVLLNKPYGVLCQFTDREGRPTLAQYVDLARVRGAAGAPVEPAAVRVLYAAGRLDHDSEGLLLLTDDARVAARITDPRHAVEKCYWVQVEGEPKAAQLDALARGVALNDGPTRPARVRRIDEPAGLWPRDPPIRFRRAIPTAWIELAIREGRNRQVRRMTAAVGLPTLRLIRARIGEHALEDLAPGALRVVEARPGPARAARSGGVTRRMR